jgi:hypothetical protein
MKTKQKLVLLAAAATVSWSVVTGAQQPQPKPGPKPPAQQPSAGKQAAVYYDSYQASHRQRLRRESCMRDEDMIAQYCVKKCQPRYIIMTSGDTVPRQCRSEKPLAPGSLPQPSRAQQAIQPVPPPPSKRVPGA